MFDFCFWAKKKEKNGILYWLPLLQHLEDTKDVAGMLWEHFLSDGQKKIIIESMNYRDEDKAKSLILFLAATHDIGKCTPAFQIKKGYANSEDLDFCLLEKLERVGFGGIHNLYSNHSQNTLKKTPHNIAGQFILKQYGVNDDIAAIIGGHHGKPVSYREEINNQSAYKENYYQSEKKESDIYKNWSKAQREFFDWALKISNFDSAQALPEIKQPAQVILSGLLIMADWIASNEEYFPLITIDESAVQDKENRAKLGFLKWQKTYKWEPSYVFDYFELYSKRFGFEPRNVQAVLSNIIEKSENPGIFILEAPMGVGKTEAALIATEQLAYKTGRCGLFFGLPTQATSNGIFPRILSWLDSISKEERENMQLRLSHGKAHLNEKFMDLASGIGVDGLEGEGTVVVNEWFSGRKTTALDDFVVGTVDQLLMLALKQKHLALRHLGFSKKVVVIDEVHAYDAYMSQYLLQAIRWLGAYKVPLLILSATLPAQRRIELVKAYMYGADPEFKSKNLKIDLMTDSYPLITYTDGFDVYQEKSFEKYNNKRVDINTLTEDLLLDTVNRSIQEGGVIAIVVNTVKRAQDLAKEMGDKFGNQNIILLHSGFIATERIKKEEKLLNIIGRGGDRPFSKIVIGTQVIEQSLDIDFDVMISDLAPMDLLIQRMGRLHRHDISRPKAHKKARFYVLGTNKDYDFETGSAYVYGEYILARTQDYLPDFINLPKDISKLVQQVYDFKKDSYDSSISDDLKQKLEQFKKEHFTKIKNKEKNAKVYRISPPVLKKSFTKEMSLIGWLKNDIIEEKANAQVRDIEPSIEVIALKKAGNAYGIFGIDKDISSDVLDYKVAKNIAKNTLILPNILSKAYNIDRSIEFLEKYNRENLSIWQESIWLKGSLGIIFDSNNEFIIGNIKIRYDEKYGLSTERV